MKLYGIAELADAIGAKVDTVAQWHHRGKLPVPYVVLRMGPVWRGKDVGAWIRRQRRLDRTTQV